MLRLRVKAPFAAFRTFTAGTFRPTAPFLTPSAAYGLLLNIAGIESRYDDGKSVMTLMRSDLPVAEIAIGAIVFPERQSIFQQLHNYPVGSSGKDHAALCRGAKYNIQPVRREFLASLDAAVCLRGNDQLEAQVRAGIRDGTRTSVDGRPRYGVPFLGDNSFMIDTLREEPADQTPAYWFRRLARDETAPGRCLTRLTAWIDRADMSRTVAHLYAPIEDPQPQPPEEAWTLIQPPPARSRPAAG